MARAVGGHTRGAGCVRRFTRGVGGLVRCSLVVVRSLLLLFLDLGMSLQDLTGLLERRLGQGLSEERPPLKLRPPQGDGPGGSLLLLSSLDPINPYPRLPSIPHAQRPTAQDDVGRCVHSHGPPWPAYAPCADPAPIPFPPPFPPPRHNPRDSLNSAPALAPAAKAGVALLKDGNLGEKPRSSVSALIDILCLDKYDEDDLDGIAELVESINLQPATGCVPLRSCLVSDERPGRHWLGAKELVADMLDVGGTLVLSSTARLKPRAPSARRYAVLRTVCPSRGGKS